MGVFKVKHGDFEVEGLICTRSAMMFIDGMHGISKEALESTDKNAVLMLDKLVSAVYFCHKAFCEDEDMPVIHKRSAIFESITINASAEESNLKDFMNKFQESMTVAVDAMSKRGNESKKKKVINTIN